VPVTTFTLPFFGTPAFYSGSGQTSLVPFLYPVAINGRPYMIDQKLGQFTRQYEPRVRDSQDISTAPGEAAINPGGLWRRGQDSWHFGAGQYYGDTAEARDFRFYKSKGINPWEKGQISLLNDTALNNAANAPTTTVGKLIVEGSQIFVIDGLVVKYASSLSGSWTTITSPASTTALKDITTDGKHLFACFTAGTSGVYSTPIATPGTWTRMIHDDLDKIRYVNGRVLGSDANIFYDASAKAYSSGPIAPGDTLLTHRNTDFQFVGFAGGNTHLYAAGFAGDVSLIYKTTIKSDATSLDAPSVAAQLPLGEIVSAIDSYLGFIFIGTNKGVRFATADTSGNLTLGAIIPTTNGSVQGFTFENRFVWFTWTNYDNTSGGLGRLDISTFTGTNTPAFATDLMYTSPLSVLSVATFAGKRIFTVSNVGVVYENTDSLVASGTIEFGTYRWGIPDRKFVVKVDVRSEPLKGSVTAYLSNDEAAYTNLGTWSTVDDTENTFAGSDTKAIEAKFKLDLTRSASVTDGPVVTRWMGRAYVTPFRSQLFTVPILLHNRIRLRNNREVAMEVQNEQNILDELITNPRVIILQIGYLTQSVIVEDIQWIPLDAFGNTWDWEGTAVVSMRSVEN